MSRAKVLSEEEKKEFAVNACNHLGSAFTNYIEEFWSGRGVAPELVVRGLTNFVYSVFQLISHSAYDADGNPIDNRVLKDRMILDFTSKLISLHNDYSGLCNICQPDSEKH